MERKARALLVILAILTTSSLTYAQEHREIRITANEFSFNPAKIQVPVGLVKFVVTNRGKFPHSLAIVGREEKMGYIESGETKSLVVKFDEAGEVIFYCSQPGHRSKGMEGKFSVGGN